MKPRITRKKRICTLKDCQVEIKNLPPYHQYCRKHSREMELQRKRKWAKKRYGKHKTLDNRILLDSKGEMRESVSARATKRYNDLWKELEKMDIYELEVLVTIIKQRLHDETDQNEIKKLRTEITIINDAFKKKIQQEEDKMIDNAILKRMIIRKEATSYLFDKLSNLLPESVEGMSKQEKKVYKKNLSEMTARDLEVESESIEKGIKQVIKYHNTKRVLETIEREVERRIEKEELTREEWEKSLQQEYSPKEIKELEKRIPYILLSDEFL